MNEIDTISGIGPGDGNSQGVELAYDPIQAGLRSASRMRIGASDDEYRAAAKRVGDALFTLAKLKDFKPNGEDQYRAAAMKAAKAMSGYADYDGRVFNGGKPFESGEAYWRKVRGILIDGGKSGLSEDYQKFYDEKDPEKRMQMADAALGFEDALVQFGGDAARAFAGSAPLYPNELQGAPEDVRAASDLLSRYESERPVMTSQSVTGATTVYGPRKSDAESAAAEQKVGAWRRQRQRQENLSKYEWQLLQENRWAALMSILPSLKEPEAEECARAIMDSKDGKLPVEMSAKFSALSPRSQDALVQIRQLSRERIEGGFWNTIGDMGVGLANTTLMMARGVGQQLIKYGRGWNEPLSREEEAYATQEIRNASAVIENYNRGGTNIPEDRLEWARKTVGDFRKKDLGGVGVDVNQLAQRQQRLWQVTGDFFAGTGKGQLPMMQFEQLSEEHGFAAQSLIGAVSTLPYMGAAMIPYAGPAIVALSAMQDFDDHVSANGGDITDPAYVASSFVLGGIYSYVERLQIDRLIGGVSEQAVREGLLKGFWSGVKNMTVPRVLFTETLSESLQEGLQNGIAGVNEALGLGDDPVRAFGKGFVEDFVGSLGTMAVIGAGGTVVGHMNRSGWHVRGKSGVSAAELRHMERSTDLDGIVRSHRAENEMVELDARSLDFMAKREAKILGDLFPIWQDGGLKALEKSGLTPEHARQADEYFKAAREANGADGKTAASALEESGADYDAPADFDAAFQLGEIDRDRYEVLLQGVGFTAEGARDYATFMQYKRTVYERLGQLQGFLDERYRAEGERGMSADLDRVRRSLRANERIRNVWAQGGGVVQKRVDDKGNVVIVSDPGAAALEKFGFTKKDAERLSRMFHYERAVAHSRVALDGIRALYDRSTRGKVSPKAAIASEFGGRVVHDNGTDYITFENGGANYAVEIREIGGGGAIDTKSNALGIARDVEIKTNGKVTAKQWLDATPEQRKQWAKLFYDEGHFAPMNPAEIVLSPAGDPGTSVDSSGARTILFGRISLQTQSGLTKVRDLEDDQIKQIVDSGAGFHEVYHAWSRFMKVTGKWTENDAAELAKKYGKGDPTLGENHDEEAAADAMRAYVTRRMEGRLTTEDEESPFAKIWSLAKKLVRHSEEKTVKAMAAATAEEAFFDQILADRFVGVGDLSGTPASSPESSAKPQTSAPTAPQMPGRTDNGADNGATEPEKKPEEPAKRGSEASEGAERSEPEGRVSGRAQRGWTAYTPTGNVKVGGHYAVVNLSEVIHSNNPAYALYMRAQLRNRKDNKAEEDTRKDIVNNFQGERLLEAPDTANGAPIVFIAPDEKGVNRMFVLSGNGRILVLNELAERHMYDKYRNVMKAWAAENGLEVPGGETPVLVRVIDDYGGATREKVSDLSNTNSIQQYTEEEQARADAEIIKSLGIARLYHANVNGSPDMTPGVNDDFFAEFIRGVGDTSLYNSDRSLTETARIRAVRALLAITVGQGERGRDVVKKLIEQTDTLNIVRQKNAAAIMAAAVAGLETNDAYSIGPDVSRAMADYIDFVEMKKAGKIGTFDEYIRTPDFINPRSEIAEEVFKLFGSKQSASDIAEYVNKYCEAAAQSDPTGGLFGEAGARTRIQIWNDATKTVDEARSKDAERHSVATLEDPGITNPYDPITKDEMNLIAAEIGTTDDPANVGFILPDGRLVKYLSHIACVQPVIFSRGIRYSEHSGYRMVGTALKSGMVRTGGLSRAWIRLGAKPSQKQRDAIRDYMEAQRKSSHYSDFTIEVEGKDNVFHSATYSLKVSPSRIFDDIDNFYDNGIEPQGQSFLSQFFHWSIASCDFEAMNRYYDGDVRSIARMLKAGDGTAISMAAGAMARAIKPGDVLIPVPSHDGRAHDTLLLADAISRITGSPVVEAIRGTVRDPIYDLKARGYLPDAEDLGFYRAADIPEDRRAVFIDNVVGTGTTAVAARQALGRGHVVAFAWDHTAPHPVGIVGGLAERYSVVSDVDIQQSMRVRMVGSVEEAGRMLKESGVVNRPLTNKALGITASITGNSLSKMMSGKATKKSRSPYLHALAVANADKVFESAFSDATHPDSHGRKEVSKVHRLGSMVFDPRGENFEPVLVTVIEYKRDGENVYTLEVVDVGAYEKNDSAGQLVAFADGERQTPIAEYVRIIAQRVSDFNHEKDRHSFAIGEVGAANLQDALFTAANLKKARELLAGRDWAKIPRPERIRIKFATGWEVGADGKWRMEKPDLPPVSLRKFKVDQSGDPKPTKEMTAEDEGATNLPYLPTTLGKLFPKAELFSSYPWLKSTKVLLGSLPQDGSTRGSYNEEAGEIKLRFSKAENAETIHTTLVHEIQHAIQRIEDFARGGNRGIVQKIFMERFKKAKEEAWPLYHEEHDLANRYLPWNERYKYTGWPKRHPERIAALEKLRTFEEYRDWERRAADFKKKWKHGIDFFTDSDFTAWGRAFRTSFKDYTKLAGEVEARNAAARHYKTILDLRGAYAAKPDFPVLLEDTEDVDRRYQTLLNGAMEQFEKLKSQEDRDARHSFAGVRAANLAGVGSLDDAEVLEGRGEDRETIFKLTGWWRGVDGHWRVELPFHGRFELEGDFDQGTEKGYRTVSDYFEWEELFSSYPELRDVEVRFEDMPDEIRGDFDPKTKTIRINKSLRKESANVPAKLKVASVMVHEIQHAIQSIENHARGGDPEQFLTWDATKIHDEIRRLELQRELTDDADEKESIDEMIQEHEIALRSDAEDAERKYYSLAGEVEARNAAERFFDSPAYRLANPPWTTQDTFDNQQILDFEPDGAQWSSDIIDNGSGKDRYSIVSRLDEEREKIEAEGGKLLLAFHGTQQGGFTRFDQEKNDDGQPGFFFSSDRDTAMTYSSAEKYDPYDDDYSPAMFEDGNALHNAHGIYNVALRMMKPIEIEGNGAAWHSVPDPFSKDGTKAKTREIVAKAFEKGYDGVIFKNIIDNGAGAMSGNLPPSNVYAVRDPEQVKSVDSVTYDDAGRIIPDARRLDWNSDDIRYSIQAWPENFPKVKIVTTLDFIKRKYEDLHKRAKAGSLPAAIELVDAIIGPATIKGKPNPKWDSIRSLAAEYPGATLVPVVATEMTGRNVIPFVYAKKIKDITGLRVTANIRQNVHANHTGADALWRMTHRPEFTGNVMRGRTYIVVDDHVTMGGTLNELRKHIQDRGGKVVAATTLTASRFSDILSLRQGTLEKLAAKFGKDLGKELHEAGIANVPAELTEAEARYLLKLSPDNLRARLADASNQRRRNVSLAEGSLEARRARVAGGGAGSLPSSQGSAGGAVGALRQGGDAAPAGVLPSGQLDGLSGGRAGSGDKSLSGRGGLGNGQAADSRRVAPLLDGSSGSGRSASPHVEDFPGLEEYKDPKTGKIGETRFARAAIFRGYISKELNSVIDDAVNAQELPGEKKLKALERLIERTKETKEGKIVIARYRSGDSIDGSEADWNRPERRAIHERIKKELLHDRITSKNNEALEIKKKTGKPKNEDDIKASNAAHPDLPAIALDETAAFDPICDRRLDIVIGPPAAGKSSVFVDKLSIYYRSRVLDADAIKKRLPGFDDGNGASYVHEESSRLNKEIIKDLLDSNKGENVVLPIVGSTAKKIRSYIDTFRNAGYMVYLHNNYVPILHAFGRSICRTTSTGRWIAPEVFLDCMDGPSAAFDEVKDMVDGWDEFNNDGPRGSDPIYVRGSYVDPAYGKVTKANDKVAEPNRRLADPQLVLDLADALDEKDGRGPIFPKRPTQGTLDFGDAESLARHAMSEYLKSNEKDAPEKALTAYLAFHRLAGSGMPRASTIARMGLGMGMNVVNTRQLLKKAESVAEQTRGTLIQRAAENGDIATTMALLKRDADINESVKRLISESVAKGGELTHKGVGRIQSLTDRRVESEMRNLDAASLADIEHETGVDIAGEILEQNPDAFADEVKKSKGKDPEGQEGDGGSDTDVPGGDAGDESGLSDYERHKREEARAEGLKKAEALIAEAKKRAAENREKAEERRKRHETVDLPGDGNGEGSDGETNVPRGRGFDPAPKNVKANFKNKWEFASFFRRWAEHKFDETHGHSTIARTQRERLFAEFYRISVRQELQDLADKLLAPKDENGVTISRIAKLGNGARVHVNRRLAELEKGVRADTIERMSADIFAFINSAAIRVSRTDLVKEFKKTLKQRFIKDPHYDEFKQDTERKVMGWVEEAARYVCRICDLSHVAVNGNITAFAAEHNRLTSIIEKREQVYNESGVPVAEASKVDEETIKARAQLALLEKYGEMRTLMPGKILDLQNEAIRYFEEEAAKLEESWKETRARQDSIKRLLAGAIVAPNGQKYDYGKGAFGWISKHLLDSLNGMLRLRFYHLVRFAPEERRSDAKKAIDEIFNLLGRGEVEYAKVIQSDREELFAALGSIFPKSDGTVDNAKVKNYVNRMTEPIPRDLSRQLSKQGHADSMTYGQMLQLLVSLEQRSFKETIELNGREGQADLIRNFEYVDEKGEKVKVFTPEDDRFVKWIRSFYAANRERLSAVTLRMVGHKVESPDPLYCPIRRLIDDKTRNLHADPTLRWDPISKIFSRRVESDRDFDEERSILELFTENSKESAKLIAWAERGSFIRNVVTSPMFQTSVRRAFGEKELGRILKQLEATFNGGESRNQTPGEIAVADKIVNFTTYAYLSFNPLSALKQTTSVWVWANMLDGGMSDVLRHMTHFDPAALKHLKESDEYKIRYGESVGSGMDYGTKGLNMNPSLNPVIRFLSNSGMWLLKKGDFAPGGWIAQGVYKDLLDKYTKEGMDYASADSRAITETFNLLEETQQSARTYNTNMLQIEHGRIGRLLTQFATSPLQQLQFETQALREWRDMVRYDMGEKKIAAARQRFVRAFFINHVLLPAGMNLVTAMFKYVIGDEPPWEKEGYHLSLLRDVILGQFASVFFIGTLGKTSFDAFFSREYARASQLLPIEGAFGMVSSGLITAHDLLTLNFENVQKDLERLLKSTAPTRIPYKIYRRLTGDADVDRKRKKEANSKK